MQFLQKRTSMDINYSLSLSKKQNETLHAMMRHWEARTRHTPTNRSHMHTQRDLSSSAHLLSVPWFPPRQTPGWSEPSSCPSYRWGNILCMYTCVCTYIRTSLHAANIRKEFEVCYMHSTWCKNLSQFLLFNVNPTCTVITVITEFMSCTLLHSAVNRSRWREPVGARQSLRKVGEVENRRGRENILEILWSWFLNMWSSKIRGSHGNWGNQRTVHTHTTCTYIHTHCTHKQMYARTTWVYVRWQNIYTELVHC